VNASIFRFSLLLSHPLHEKRASSAPAEGERASVKVENLARWAQVLTRVFSRSLLCALQLAALASAQTPHPAACRRVEIAGQANAGVEWRQPIGQGWVFRLVPIAAGYTGWDLVVDRTPGAGFPDALLLATPPYDSINEHEIGTTYGLRSQDALGWNPRSFRFLTDPAVFASAQKLYRDVHSAAPSVSNSAAQTLLALAAHASAGQFRILDARIVPGAADPAPFAQAWALRAARTPHTIVPNAPPTPRGRLEWIRFSITLRLPINWNPPAPLESKITPCE